VKSQRLETLLHRFLLMVINNSSHEYEKFVRGKLLKKNYIALTTMSVNALPQES